jgi:hypothetical protein
MATQLLLFSSDQDLQPDGTIVVRPRRLVDGREISAEAAAKLLGFRDKDTVCRMVQAGLLKGWKPESKRGNAKYRIDLGSVMEYKERRLKAERDE